MILDEEKVNFTDLLTDRAYFDQVLSEASELYNKPGSELKLEPPIDNPN